MRKLLLLPITLPLAAARGALQAVVRTVADALVGEDVSESPVERRPSPPPPAAPSAPPPPPAPPIRVPDDEPTRGEINRRRLEQREEEGGGPGGVGAEVRVDEPWDGYDEMTAAQVLERLVGADEATIGVVRLYEAANRNRATVLRATET